MKKAIEMEQARLICLRAASKLTRKRQAELFHTTTDVVNKLHASKEANDIMVAIEGIKDEFLNLAKQLTRQKQAEAMGVCVNTIERFHNNIDI